MIVADIVRLQKARNIMKILQHEVLQIKQYGGGGGV